MDDYVKKCYEEKLRKNSFIVTEKAKDDYERFLQKWKETIDKFPDDENDLKVLYKLSNELIYTCCADNYLIGFKSGQKAMYQLFEMHNFFQIEDE